MPPALATALTYGFILWLLYRNSRQRGSAVSVGLWIPTIWVTIISSRPVGYWLGASSSTEGFGPDLDGSPADRNVLLGLIFLSVLILVRRRIDWAKVLRGNRVLWVFYSYLLLSVLWSDYSDVSFKRWIKEIGNVFMILIILTQQDPVVATREVFLRCAYFLVPLSILVCKYYLDIGRYYNAWTGAPAFCGVTCDKNALGRLAMVSVLFLLWSLSGVQKRAGWVKWTRSALPDLLMLLLCLWVLRLSGSATSLGCTIVGAGLFFASRTSWVKLHPRLFAFSICGFVLLSFLFLAIPDFRALVTNSLGRKSDLTERTDIWERAMKLKTNPLIGAGFASVWLTPAGRQLCYDLNVPHSHNGYMETYLNSGVIGLGLLLIIIYRAGKQALGQLFAGSQLGHLYIALFGSCLIYNYTEAAFNNNNVVGFIVFLIATQYYISERVGNVSTQSTGSSGRTEADFALAGEVEGLNA